MYWPCSLYWCGTITGSLPSLVTALMWLFQCSPYSSKMYIANSCLILKALVHPPLCSIPHINAGAFGACLVLIPSLVSCTIPCIIFLINCDPNTLLLFDHFVVFDQLLPLSFLILKRRLPFDTSSGL